MIATQQGRRVTIVISGVIHDTAGGSGESHKLQLRTPSNNASLAAFVGLISVVPLAQRVIVEDSTPRMAAILESSRGANGMPGSASTASRPGRSGRRSSP